MWILIALATVAAEPASTKPVDAASDARAVAVIDQPSRDRADLRSPYSESANFVVRSHVAHQRADDVARHCELQLRRLCDQLLGKNAAAEWQPKCEVVLHPSRASYLQATGPGGGQTVGSSTIQIQNGEIIHRRVDLLAEDPSRALAALSHELIHIVFAELFPDEQPPRWAEEGLALLNDNDDKRSRHLNDLRNALHTRTTLPLDSLFSASHYPTGWQRAVFYGQSLSLVQYLIQLDTPEQFVLFVELSMQTGHGRALETVYKIDGVGDLQDRWHKHALAQAAKRTSPAP